MANPLPIQEKVTVISMLAEGSSIRRIERITGMKLAGHHLSRAVMHLSSLVRDRTWAWHLSGLWWERFGRARTVALYAAVAVLAAHCVAGEPMGHYTEPFRPQFHFTPEKNWMNDPNGLVYYHGKYNLFYQYNPFGNKWGHMSWGHAVSSDLVHWKHLPLALAEANGVMCFSGSAVVDWHNTSGFGRNGQPPLVAIYTGMRVADGRQFQCLAYSNNGGLTWTKYAGNPIIDIGSDNFRDPKVQWYAPTKKWIMTVALSAEHKVCFYGSKDLKHWTRLSEFGPAGATAGVWECPDLFPLAVNSDTNRIKWVLTVNVGSGAPAGGTGVQYFVGDFDGIRFREDAESLSSSKSNVAGDEVLADFEEDNYGNWKVTGNAFGSGPVHPDASVTGYLGRKLVESYGPGDNAQGTLTSPEFTLNQDYLDFLIGGGAHPHRLGMNLLINGVVEKTATGNNSPALQWKTWSVRKYRGEKAQLEIFDNYTNNDWGHIYIDQIVLASSPVAGHIDNTLWADYGPDYYAANSWNDVPPSDGRRLWIGWMSNGQYSQDVPTSPWRSAMSIPRELGLLQTPQGIRLVQEPVRELQSLRDQHFQFQSGNLSQANAWIKHKHIAGNELEILLDFKPAQHGTEGIKVLKGPGEATVIGVDRDSCRVFVDRRHSGDVSFNSKFPGIYYAPLARPAGNVRLHIFVDACSVEVFVNGGREVFTSLVFPSAQGRRLEVFGPEHTYIGSFDVWSLKSIWHHGTGFPEHRYQTNLPLRQQ